MSNFNVPKSNETPEGNPQSDRLKSALGAIGAAMDEVGAAAEKRAYQRSSEIIDELDEPQTTLEQYPDGSVVKIYRGSQRLEAKELVDITRDPVADDMPVLIRATGKRRDGTFEQRFVFLSPEAAIAGVLDPEGKPTFLKDKSVLLEGGSLDSIPPIEIGKAWQSPVGNLGRVDSVTVPYTHGYKDDWLAQTHDEGAISPLAIGRDKTDEFKRMRGAV